MNNYQIKGAYQFEIPVQGMFLDRKLIIKGKNLITFLGESFFLTRAFDNEFPPIKYIVLGRSNITPDKQDLDLGNETLRLVPKKKVDLQSKKLMLEANIEAKSIEGICEIGAHNGEVLISHDVFPIIDTNVLNLASNVNMRYTFTLSTGYKSDEWESSTKKQYVYYTTVKDFVTSVSEQDTNSGYRKVESLDKMMEATYYYQNASKTLYIQCSNNDNPSNHQIIIKT